MTTLKGLLVSILIVTGAANINAQKAENPFKGLPFKERVTFGGDLGLSFGSDITYIRVAPMLGYIVSPKFTIGGGPSYQYWRDSRPPTFESTIWGGAAFARYFVVEQLFLQTQFELLNLDEIAFTVDDLNSRGRVTIPVLLVGGGYAQQIRTGSGLFVSIMYDVIGDINSPYPNDLVFRIGGFVGF